VKRPNTFKELVFYLCVVSHQDAGNWRSCHIPKHGYFAQLYGIHAIISQVL